MVLPFRESRRLQRTRFSAEQHFDALDADADEFEAIVANLGADIKAQRAVLVGLLVTIATAAVVGAINILMHAV